MNVTLRRTLSLVSVLLVLAVAGQAAGAVYVVDQTKLPGAADTNAGSEQAPFKTVQHAAEIAKAGDMVYVMPGRYDERVRVKASGAKGKLITFQSQPRRAARVGGFDLAGASYIRIEGFEITATTPATGVALGGHYCEVVDNYIHDMAVGVDGIIGKLSADRQARDYSAVTHTHLAYNKVYHCQYGFLLGGEDWLVENNEVSRLFMYGRGDSDYTRFFGKNCIHRYNYYHGSNRNEVGDAHVDCIQTFADNGEIAQNLLFEYNTCFDFSQGCMLESQPHFGNMRKWTFHHNIYSSKATLPGAWGVNLIQIPDVTIENNTFAGIVYYGIGLRGKESANGRIVNNICYDMENAVDDHDGGFPQGANPLIEYNLTFKTKPAAGPKNLNDRDPLFVDPDKRDFRLRKGSPAIKAGQDGATIGALDYPNVYYVDPRHPGACDEPAWGYPGTPLATVNKACTLAQPGEVIVLRGGVYRETVTPKQAGQVIRAFKGEKAFISGADLIVGWQREADGGWSAALAAEPRRLLRDGKEWKDYTYDGAKKRVVLKAGEDPRLHVFETVVREVGLLLGALKDVKLEGVSVINILGPAANGADKAGGKAEK